MKDDRYLNFLKQVKVLVDSSLEKEEKILTPKEKSEVFRKQIIEYFSKETVLITEYSFTRPPIQEGYNSIGIPNFSHGNTIHITINTTK